MPQFVGPHAGVHLVSIQAALSAHCSSCRHSGRGGAVVTVVIRSQRTNGYPVYPAGQEQTAECLTPVHIAFIPQALMQGSEHFLLMQARSPGQSSFTMHSG